MRLTELERIGYLSPFDTHFARTLGEIGHESNPLVLLGAALASRYTVAGHVCAPLEKICENDLITPDGSRSWDWPDLTTWTEALSKSPIVGSGKEKTPLVLDEGLLYLYRYYRYECYLANEFTTRTHLQVISGGPGTGKTTRVVSLLADLFERAANAKKPAPRVALLAPTGKSAARLTESIQIAKRKGKASSFEVPKRILASIPEDASTIHRALGTRPKSATQFIHNETNPLGAEVVVVDEVSMVDLALMAKLFMAVQSDAKLFLLGDENQLASVEAGAVLGELSIPERITHLEGNFRFGKHSGIGRLAEWIVRGDWGEVINGLESGAFDGIDWIDSENWQARDLDRYLASSVVPRLLELWDENDPAKRLRRFDSFRVISAHRNGVFGVAGINQLVEQTLRNEGIIATDEKWYDGRPILVTRNDYELGLFNGDLGVVSVDREDPNLPKVVFLGGGSSTREVPVSRLHQIETAFAMTVHKSQGSEFDESIVVLPTVPTQVATRELLYTAVTRARNKVTLISPKEVLQKAVVTPVDRTGGLARRLRNL